MTLVNPYLQWPVSQGWREGSHALPGGGPAIDYAIPHGTPLLSPDDGRVFLAQGGDGGLVVILVRSDNSQIVLCHNSELIVHHGDRVHALEPLSLSGNTGRVYPAPTPADPFAGSHLHTYGLHPNGLRWDWTRDAAPMPAGGGAIPLPKPPEPEPERPIQEDEMRGFAIENTSRGTVYYKYAIDDAATMRQDEASALCKALGLRRLPRLTGTEAKALLTGIKFMRSRREERIANRVNSELKDDFADIDALIADIDALITTEGE